MKQKGTKTPKLVCSKSGWRVVYYDVRNGKSTRITLRVEHVRKWYKNATEAKQIIEDTIIKPIAAKLLSLNIVTDPQTEKPGATFKEIINEYSTHINDTLGTGTNTANTYQSYLSQFFKYIKEKNLLDTYANEWKKSDIEEYINTKKKKGIKITSINNNIGFIKKMFAFAYEEDYIKKNIAESIKKIKNTEYTERRIYTEEELKKIANYLKKNDFDFYVFTQLVFSCFLRPIEIQRLQVSNIDFENQKIILNGEKTKNHKKRTIIIPTNMWDKTKGFWQKIHKLDKDMYLFGEDLKPSKKKISNPNTSTLRWNKIKEELNLPKECLLYGFRHTGITKLLQDKNLSNNEIRMHTGHETIAMLERYGRHITEDMEQKYRQVNCL